MAILCVVIYHAFPKMLPGGFVGVDVFFVISGFLISSFIFSSLDEERFSFLDFYGRRIRRIFPALLVVLAFCFAYGTIVLLPTELAQLGKNIAGGAAFFSNVLLWSEAGYFDTAAVFKPLLHLWSLGVEEQFYILWPVLLWIVYKLGVRRGAFLGIFLLCSFGANVVLYGDSPSADFYLPFSRFWELAAGSILAWLALRPSPPKRAFGKLFSDPARARQLSSIAGLAMIVGSAVFLDPAIAYPGWWALFPITGAMLLVAAGPATLINRAILSHRIPVFIGLISYPLYLWHWPLIAYAHILRLGHRPPPLMAAGLVAASALLAWLTYRLVETPIRFGDHLRFKSLAMVTLMGATAIVGVSTWEMGGFALHGPGVPDVNTLKINLAVGDGVFKPTKHMAVRNIHETYVTEIGDGHDAVLLTGDSVLFQYGPRVEELYREGRLRKKVYFVAGASCPPYPGIIESGSFAHCRDMPQIAADLVAERKIGTVVIGALWAAYRGHKVLVERSGGRMPIDSPAAVDDTFANLEDYVRQFIRSGRKVYLVLSVPTGRRFDPELMISRSLTGFSVNQEVLRGVVPVRDLRAESAAMNQRLMEIAARTGAKTMDPLTDICGHGPVCSAFFGDGEPKYADKKHLRPLFVKTNITFLDALLTQTGD